MDSDDEEDNHGLEWDTLETITKFDGVHTQEKQSSISSPASTELIGNGLKSRVASKTSTPVSLLVESLVQQLCALLETDPKRSQELYSKICERLHAINLIDETYAMGEFEMMRSQYQKALYQLVSIARGENLPVAVLENIWPLQQPAGLEWSRYYREFTELEFIAGGGFGKVYRAKNNLDGTVYAVKKITIQATTIKNVLVHLAEVKTLASLNHVNIVPYKAAWLEPLLASGAEAGDARPEKGPGWEMTSLEDNDETSESVSFSFSREIQTKSRRKKSSLDDSLKRRDDTDDFSIHFENSQDGTEEYDQQLAELEEARGSVFSIEETQPHVKLKWATLYIQMTLCHITLREWLDDRNRLSSFDEFYAQFLRNAQRTYPPSAIARNSFCRQTSSISSNSSGEDISKQIYTNTPSPRQDDKDLNNSPQHLDVVTDVLNQLLNGLTYIHSRGIVHHDIKPSNIFVSVNDYDKSISIQLGDFGLACPLQNSHTGVGFGTPLYAAPEQLAGKCDPKSDIYSLGIILLELLIAFDTDMGRAEMIKEVRRGKFPKDLDPEYGSLLTKLLSTRPTKRPDTFALTEAVNCMKLNRDKVISELRRSLSLQEEEIDALKRKIEQQSRQREDSLDEVSQLEMRTSETLIVKEQELIYKTMEIESKIQQLQFKELELRTKDAEIDRLRRLLKTYQEKDEQVDKH
ncbi:eukaryotic translation initiation factor 2-alpha kinase 1-like [Malaya genurostris]|uniref:eukaryotic translation initiation factor 2-alpha kinase 1-like n=1 Tax=Malaya genurostris TaxID=325434 RepID=UPI0026F3B191|nr:eukaryotic translation initiation factor 2-alpha kinase 1-like [Malaya genurostris]